MMLRRRSRTDRVLEEVKSSSPLVRSVTVAFAVAGLVALSFMARKRLWQALASFADAVEEVADTVEDAAEDVRDAAQTRAQAS
jgi:hypothetical protein